MRVLHLPARTTFARALHAPERGIEVVNSTGGIPVDASLDWLARAFPAGQFDVVHIHTTELADPHALTDVLAACHAGGKGLVATLHEDTPLFDRDRREFGRRLRQLREAGTRFATLTDTCRAALASGYGLPLGEMVVIPHGNVLAFDSPLWTAPPDRGERPYTFTLHGGFRPNKRLFDVAVSFAFAPALRDARLHILTRAFALHEVSGNPDLRAVLDLALKTDRITLSTAAHITDAEIARFVAAGDAMVLPYAWGSHSGQLELAHDLGMPVVATETGHYRAQAQVTGQSGVTWVDWANTSPYEAAATMLTGLQSAMAAPARRRDGAARRTARQRERAAILDAYGALYHAALSDAGQARAS